MSRSMMMAVCVIGVCVLETDLLACSRLPTPISKGGSLSVVIATVTTADSMSAQVRVESVLKSQLSANDLSLITTESPATKLLYPSRIPVRGRSQVPLDVAKKERLGGAKQKRAMDNGENLPLKPLKSLRSLQKDFDAQTEIIEEAEGLPSIRFWPEDSFIEIYDFFLDLPLESDYQSELVREEEADLYE